MMAHEDEFDFNTIFSLFSSANNNIHFSTKKIMSVDGYVVTTKFEVEYIAKKFVYWLKKNNWTDLGNISEDIEFIKSN
jgi:predicted choloylglycine hydrolase